MQREVEADRLVALPFDVAMATLWRAPHVVLDGVGRWSTDVVPVSSGCEAVVFGVTYYAQDAAVVPETLHSCFTFRPQGDATRVQVAATYRPVADGAFGGGFLVHRRVQATVREHLEAVAGLVVLVGS